MHRLHLNDYYPIDNDIEFERWTDHTAAIKYRHIYLSVDVKRRGSQFDNQASLINRLEETRPQRVVNCYRAGDDLLSEIFVE